MSKNKKTSTTAPPKGHRPQATMVDVARHAGVSTATVSRTLNEDPAVTAETKDRVNRAVEALGYVVHRQAQALRSKRSGNIAVHIPNVQPGTGTALANPFVLEFLGVLGEALHKVGLDMLVSHSPSLEVSLHKSGLVDGYVQLGRGVDDSLLINAVNSGIPVVVWAPPSDGQSYVSVGVDNIDLARQAVNHLIECGRRRIALISGDLDHLESEGSLRRAGYVAALAAAGFTLDPRIIESADGSERSGAQAIRRILNADPNIDAVFAAHGDVVSLSVQRELADIGIEVPRDIAVVGFDNIQMAEFAHPRLTTVDQSLSTGLPILVDRLLQLIEGRPAKSVVVEGRLVVRESCGSRSSTVPTSITASTNPRPDSG